MKKLILLFGLLLFAVNASATCIVQVTWTPGNGAVRESLRLDGVEKDCDASGYCEFVVPDLTNQQVVVRSFNNQGNYVDSEAHILAKDPLPGNAVIIRVQTTCTE